METLLKQLRRDYPAYRFTVGEQLCWSPEGSEIRYEPNPSVASTSGLLHELAHALLGHKKYTSDLDLLQKEVAAWGKAVELAKTYHQAIDPSHVQDCLDTYRDWLHKRSTCPVCGLNGVQQATGRYTCLNCSQIWAVSARRFARPYRRQQPAVAN